MLRFDVPPVASNVARLEAFLTFAVCIVALLGAPWLMAPLALQAFVRGFLGHHREPLHGVWKRLLSARGLAGKPENAGAKMFAAKILFVASTVAVLLLVAGSPLWKVPVSVLVAFSFLEWAFSFCAACWAYGFWYARFPPKSG